VVQAGLGSHPLEIVFTSLSVDEDGRVISSNWSFGDGSFGQGESVRHAFANAGDYLVELTVTDDSGGSDMATFDISPHVPNLSLSDASIDRTELGWSFSANVNSDAGFPMNFTLRIEAGGRHYQRQFTVGGEELHVTMPLENFTGGKISATLDVREGWDADDADNSWTGSVDTGDETHYWIAAGVAIVAVAAAMVFFIRRRR